ncbi:MAG: hypothetical protein ACI841_000907 [Planctomycetota bacterium]|jgi:hypothetical protein
MKHRSRRGAARISAVWMIVVVVMFFVAVFFGYISNQAAAKADTDRDTAVAAKTAAEMKRDEAVTATRAVSDVLGFIPQGEIGATSNVTTAQDGLESLKQVYPNMDDTIDVYEKAIPIMIAQYNAKVTEVETLNSTIADLRSQVKQAREQMTTVVSQKDAALASLQSDKDDFESNATSTQESLQSRLDDAQSDRNDKDEALRTSQVAFEDSQREINKEKSAATTRFNKLSQKLAFVNEPESPDGEILAISSKLGLGWINRGSTDRIQRGMVFDVISGTPGIDTVKGRALVMNVKENSAEVEFFDIADQFDPIADRDIITNPLYDPAGPRNAVLVGRFGGSYNRRDLTRLCADIGITIQKKVDMDTDYLIVGSELYVDDSGEPFEEPLQPSDLPEYKNAEALGASIVSIRAIRDFFKK